MFTNYFSRNPTWHFKDLYHKGYINNTVSPVFLHLAEINIHVAEP